MRLILLTSLLLICAGLSHAENNEAKCALFLDDCEGCIKNNHCGWCTDGFCTALKSPYCSDTISNDNAQCTKTNNRALQLRQGSDPCSVNTGPTQCPTCRSTAGCVVCIPRGAPPGNTEYVCRQDDCDDDLYNPTLQNGTCPTVSPSDVPSPNSNPLTITFTITLPAGSSLFNPANNYYNLRVAIAQALAALNPAKYANFPSFGAIIISLGLKRQQRTAVIAVQFADFPNKNPALKGNEIAQEFADAAKEGKFDSSLGVTSVTVGGKSGGSSGVGLSKGALAGIIIGSIFGGLLLMALLAFLLLRSRESYPVPFRSPAAAYRP